MARKLRVETLPDGFSRYMTLEGDLVDEVAFAFYGTHSGTTEMLYADNPHLLSLDMILPEGVAIRLRPAAPATATKSQINLWD